MNHLPKAGDVTDLQYIGGNKSFQFSWFPPGQGDFVRLRNVQLGYDFPKHPRQSWWVACFLCAWYEPGPGFGANLGWDPEQGVSSQTNLDVYIPARSHGLNLGL